MTFTQKDLDHAVDAERASMLEFFGFIVRAALGAASHSPMFYDHAHNCWLCYCCRRMQIGPEALKVPGQHSSDCVWFLLWRTAGGYNHEPWARHRNANLTDLKQWFWQIGVEGHEAITVTPVEGEG